MTQLQKSDQNGESKGETTVPPPASPSSNAENPSTLVTLDFTAEAKSQTDSQLTPNSSQENPNSIHARMVMAFVAKLGELVEVKKVTLRDGRAGWAIFFPNTYWEVDSVSKSLRLR